MREFEGYKRGINLGGWLSQYTEDSEEHRKTFITEEDIKKISEAGLDHVRVPVDYDIIEKEDGTVREDGHSYISRCISWCERYGLKMVLDLHKTYGYSFDPSKKEDKTKFFRDGECHRRFYGIWTELAKRYGKYSDTVAFELLNEVVPYEVANEWNDIALAAISKIRRYSPDSWIVIGGVMYNSLRAVPLLPDISDRKVVYTFHCYDPMVFTHQGAGWMDEVPDDLRVSYPLSLREYRDLSDSISPDIGGDISDPKIDAATGPEMFSQLFADAVRVAGERDIPLYCGEYGVIENASAGDTVRWFADIHEAFERYGLARACWTYKSMCFGLMDERLEAVRDDLSDYF